MGFRKIRQSVKEEILTVVLVTVFFAIFAAVLLAAFPSGTVLDVFTLSDHKPDRPIPAAGPGRLRLSKAGGPSDATNGDRFSARVMMIKNRVKSKRAADLSWESAVEGMTLFERDAVQTLDHSTAEVLFDNGYALNIDSNTLLVIEHLQSDRIIAENRSLTLLVEGRLKGRLVQSSDPPAAMEIATPGGTMRVKAEAGQTQAEFSIAVHPDQSSHVAVYKGKAQWVSGGRSVVIGPNQVARIEKGQSPQISRRKPVIDLIRPAQDARIFYRRVTPEVRFEWKPAESAPTWRLVVARDAGFTDIVTRQDVADNARTLRLPQGRYFWKVQPLSGRARDATSATRQFQVLQDLLPPPLEVRFPSEAINDRLLALSGRTEPGARVFVGGEPVSISASGRFKHIVELRPGANVIAVAAIDAADNVASRSGLVTFKP